MKLIAVVTTAMLMASPLYAASHAMSAEAAMNKHIADFGAGDLDALVAGYTEDAVIITPTGVMKGHEELRGMISAYLAEFAKPGMSFTIDSMTVDGDTAQVVWHGETADNTYQFAAESYHFKDGLIDSQTFAGVVVPK